MEEEQQQLELRSLVMKLTKHAGDKKGVYKMLNQIMRRAGEGYYYAIFVPNEVNAIALDFFRGCGFKVTEVHIVAQIKHGAPRQVQRYFTLTWQQ